MEEFKFTGEAASSHRTPTSNNDVKKINNEIIAVLNWRRSN